MDSAYNISNPEDWLQTTLPTFSPLETALRCQVCKDFFKTPMITSCSHTFCSKCIRDYLSIEGKCPACRASEQESKLRRNWVIGEVVANFQAARPAALELARQSHEQHEEGTRSRRSNKRRRVEQEEPVQNGDTRRQTRSRTKRLEPSSTQESIEIMDTEDEQPERKMPEPDDGLVSCPMCGQRMKEETVFGHLDRCDGENKEKRKKSQPQSFPIKPPSRPTSAQPQERLSQLNYSLLKDNPLRKKLQDLGIPNWGNRQLLIRRHVEWVNTWNANCDSDKPRTKRELLRDLDTWEHSQGGHAKETAGSTNGLMAKDFDAQAYAKNHKDDFSRLIEEARKKAKSAPKPETSNPMDGQNGVENPAAQRSTSSGDAKDSDYEQRHPYENNEEALRAVREKVKAAEQGEPVELTQNEGFRDETDAAESTIRTNDSTKPPEAENEALLSQAHFGSQHHRKPGVDPEACELPEHLKGSPSKKVPMFMVPEEPVVDVENEPSAQ